MNFAALLDKVILFSNEYSLKILVVIVIFFIGKFIAKQITIFTKKIMLKARVDATLVVFVSNLIYFILLLLVFLVALDAVNINTTSFLTVLGAATLGIGLALKDSLANIGAAVVIIIFRPFGVGDVVQVAGSMGTIKEINLFSTVLEPIDKSIVTIPNSSVLGQIIINFSNRKERRVDHVFSIGYKDDLKKAKEILQNIIDNEPRILQEPEPLIAVGALSANSVDLFFRVWTPVDDYWKVYYETIENVKLEFDKVGISSPYQQIDIHSK